MFEGADRDMFQGREYQLRRIASAGVLVFALTFSLMAITRADLDSGSTPLASGGDLVSVAAGGEDAVVAASPVLDEAVASNASEVAVVAAAPLVTDGAVAVASEATTAPAPAGAIIAPEIDSRRRPPWTTTTRPAPATTTTIVPTTSTTTSPPITTTTALPTTTTVGSPTSPMDRFITRLMGGTEVWWEATYLRTLPFTPGVGWVDGDRAAYRCMYGFLQQDNRVVGRVTFMAVEEAASYTMVNDKYMEEGVRFYDGSVAPLGGPIELGQCPHPSQDYAALTGPGQLPTINFSTVGGSLLEVRNYKTLAVADGVVFQQTESTDQRVTVVAYFDNLPTIVVYYESMVSDVIMSSDLG